MGFCRQHIGVGCHSFPGGSSWLNPGLPHCRWILYCWNHQGTSVSDIEHNNVPLLQGPRVRSCSWGFIQRESQDWVCFLGTLPYFVLGSPQPLEGLSLLFCCSVLSDSLWPHGLQHSRLPCAPQSPGVCSNSCALSQWCHPSISSSVTPFSSHLHSFPASGSFPVSQFFASWCNQLFLIFSIFLGYLVHL